MGLLLNSKVSYMGQILSVGFILLISFSGCGKEKNNDLINNKDMKAAEGLVSGINDFVTAVEPTAILSSSESEKELSLEEEITASDAYDRVIERYKEACSVEGKEWLNNLEFYNSTYNDLHTDMLEYYHEAVHYDEILEGDVPCILTYVNCDIDKNGIPELLLFDYGGEVACFDIYTFDGKSAVRLFQDSQSLYTSYGIFTDGVIAKYQDGVTYYSIDSANCNVVKLELLDTTDLLYYQFNSDEWIVFAEDIVASAEESEKLEAVQSTLMSTEEVCQAVTDYYNELNHTDVYEAFEKECQETAEGYFLILRSTGGNTANVLVTGLSINVSTGEVTDDYGENWNLYEYISRNE